MPDAPPLEELAAGLLAPLGRAAGHRTLAEALSDPLLAALLWRVARDELAPLWPERAELDRAMAAAYTSARPLPDEPPPALAAACDPARPLLAVACAGADRATLRRAVFAPRT